MFCGQAGKTLLGDECVNDIYPYPEAFVHIHFRKISRGPAWERWLLIEDQRGEDALAGEAILTYSDIGGYSDVECDVLFARDLDDDEIDDLLDAVISILSGQGNVTIFTARQIVTRGFSLQEEDEDSLN